MYMYMYMYTYIYIYSNYHYWNIIIIYIYIYSYSNGNVIGITNCIRIYGVSMEYWNTISYIPKNRDILYYHSGQIIIIH